MACYVATGKSPRRFFPAICTRPSRGPDKKTFIQQLIWRGYLYESSSSNLVLKVIHCDVHAG